MIESMKPKRTFAALALLLFAALISACGHEGASVASLKSQSIGAKVRVKGKVSNLRSKRSRKGNTYYTFYLTEGSDRILVFSFGSPSVEDGDTAVVSGEYATYGTEKEIKASSIDKD